MRPPRVPAARAGNESWDTAIDRWLRKPFLTTPRWAGCPFRQLRYGGNECFWRKRDINVWIKILKRLEWALPSILFKVLLLLLLHILWGQRCLFLGERRVTLAVPPASVMLAVCLSCQLITDG